MHIIGLSLICRRQTCKTCYVLPIVLYTKLDAKCDKARIPRHRHRLSRQDFRGDVGVSGESAMILARMSVSV